MAMKTATVLGAALAVVVLCLIGSYFVMENNNSDSQDFLGEWTLEHIATGKYVDDEPCYEVVETFDLEMKITDRKDGFYNIQIGDEKAVCALDGDILTFSMFNADVLRGFAKADGDWIKVSTVDYSTRSVTVLDFVRKGVDAGNGAPTVKSDMPADGTILDAFQAYRINSDSTTDIMSNEYSFEMLENHGDVAFYISHCEDPYIDFRFVSIKIDEGQWFSMAIFNDDILMDNIYLSNGNIYSFSQEELVDENRVWYVAYGDAAKHQTIPAKLAGLSFEGKEKAMLFDCEPNLIREFSNDITLTIDAQSDDIILISTDYGGENFHGTAQWASFVAKSDGGYMFFIQSQFFYEGKHYFGYYSGTIDSNLKKVSFNGVADCDYGKYYIVVSQSY